MSMQGSLMMYVIARPSLPMRPDAAAVEGPVYASIADELVDDLPRAFHERRFDDHLVEARGVRALEAEGVRVVREAENRGLGPRVGDLLRVDAGDVADHEIGRVGAVARDEPMPASSPSSFERNMRSTPTSRIVAMGHGLARRRGCEEPGREPRGGSRADAGERWFDAHEALEDEWREAPAEERDFLQGLVHVTVAWHHASSGNQPGASRQLEKASPATRPLRAGASRRRRRRVLGQVEAASARVAEGLLDLLPVRI